MQSRFIIEVGGRRAIAELVGDAPALAGKFWESLPLDSFAIHAKFAGSEMIVMLPFHAESENEILEVRPGDIGFFPEMQTLCLFFDDVTPFGKVSVFARVVEGLDEMRAAGSALLADVSAPVRLSRDGPVGRDERLPTQGWRMSEVVRSVWDREPADIERLRDTALPPGGRWSGILFCDLLLLWSGQTLMSLRSLARSQATPVEALATVAAAHTRQLADWIAHWRMDDTAATLRSTASRLERGDVHSAHEFVVLLEDLVLLVNRVQTWIDAFVPWATLDDRFPGNEGAIRPGAATRG